jgi:MYXO-CTERM domain-containing protein
VLFGSLRILSAVAFATMNGMSAGLRIGVVLALVCVSSVAWSKAAGITGKSGKQGPTCISCHVGGTAPNVSFAGPTSLDAGVTAVYTFHVQTNASTTGMNVAATDGVAMIAGADGLTRVDPLSDEVTQKSPVKPVAGEAVYSFSITAPPFAGTVRLWGAGNACNGDGRTSGDDGADTTFDIAINGPPNPNPPPTDDSGSPITPPPTTPPSPPNDGTDASTGTNAEGGLSSSSGGNNPGTPGDNSHSTSGEGDSGCNVTDKSGAPAGAMVAALIGLAALTRKRRRR